MRESNEVSLREIIRLNLIYFMKKAEINQVQFAEKLGISKGTVNNWVRGNNSPDLEMVPKICEALQITIPDLYSHHLAGSAPTKKAPLYSSEALKLAEDYELHMSPWGRKQVRAVADIEVARYQEQQARQAAPAQAEGATVEKLIYLNPAAAGTPLYAESDFERMSFPEGKAPPEADFGIRIAGHSMEPGIPDGAIVWVRKTLELQSGAVGVFMVNDSAVCKRFYSGGGNIRLESDNPAYGPVELKEGDNFKLVGEVVGVVKP